MRIAVCLFVALFAGCGYHTPGAHDAWVGGDARVLYVQLLENQTSEPYLENYLTDALVAELSKSRVLRLTEDPAQADVLLSGEVSEFKSRAQAYSSDDRITDYRATMTATVRLVRRGSGEVLWQEKLHRKEDYLATVNKNLQLEGQRLAAQEVSRRLAEDVSAGLLNNF